MSEFLSLCTPRWTKMTLMARKTTFEYNPIMPEQKSSEKMFDMMQQYDMRITREPPNDHVIELMSKPAAAVL